MKKPTLFAAVGVAAITGLALAAPVQAAPTGSAQIAGTVGEIVDPDAGPDFTGQAGYFLRYVGDPAPAGYSHDYQWATPYIETVSPETEPVVFEGTLDLTNRQNGTTAFIGLNDKTSHESGAGGGGDADSVWTDGANISIQNHTNGDVKLGPSDGNAGGGEYVQVFHTILAADIPADGLLSVKFVIDGTADPTTCGGLAGEAGCLTLNVGDLAPLNDSYGAKLAPNSAVPEFANGGHPGWDASHSEGGDIGYDLTVSPVVVSDPSTRDDCKDGGWEDFGFSNQGECIRYVITGQDSR